MSACASSLYLKQTVEMMRRLGAHSGHRLLNRRRDDTIVVIVHFRWILLGHWRNTVKPSLQFVNIETTLAKQTHCTVVWASLLGIGLRLDGRSDFEFCWTALKLLLVCFVMIGRSG
jgi:hypothetical protein